MYMLQNMGVLLSAAAMLPLLADSGGSRRGGDPGGSPVVFWALTVGSIACGSAASVGSMGSTLAVERQWTKALCCGNTEALAAMNSGAQYGQSALAPIPCSVLHMAPAT